LTLKVATESHVTWGTSVPILVFLGLSVLDLGPMHATDRRQTDRRQTASSLYAPALSGWGIITLLNNPHVNNSAQRDGVSCCIEDFRRLVIEVPCYVDPAGIKVDVDYYCTGVLGQGLL